VFVVVLRVVQLSNLLSPAGGSFPGTATWLGTQISVLLSPSCPHSFLIVQDFGFFESFLSEAATNVLLRLVFFPVFLLCSFMAGMIADSAVISTMVLYCIVLYCIVFQNI
jgi:hypothetical protein